MVKTKWRSQKSRHSKPNLPKKISTRKRSNARKLSSPNCRNLWNRASVPKTNPTNTRNKCSSSTMKSNSSRPTLSIWSENPFSQVQSPQKLSKKCSVDQTKSHRCSWRLKGSERLCFTSRGHWISCKMSSAPNQNNLNSMLTGSKTKSTSSSTWRENRPVCALIWTNWSPIARSSTETWTQLKTWSRKSRGSCGWSQAAPHTNYCRKCLQTLCRKWHLARKRTLPDLYFWPLFVK